MTSESQLAPAEELQLSIDDSTFEQRRRMSITPWMIMTVALLAIAGAGAVSAWVLLNAPTEGERAQIIEFWQNVGIAAFAYFIGSSAGSRNAAAQAQI